MEYNSANDYYKILRVSSNATTDEIEAATERMLSIYSPEDFGEYKDVALSFVDEIKMAAKVLLDPVSRLEYDEERRSNFSKLHATEKTRTVEISNASGQYGSYVRPWISSKQNGVNENQQDGTSQVVQPLIAVNGPSDSESKNLTNKNGELSTFESGQYDSYMPSISNEQNTAEENQQEDILSQAVQPSITVTRPSDSESTSVSTENSEIQMTPSSAGSSIFQKRRLYTVVEEPDEKAFEPVLSSSKIESETETFGNEQQLPYQDDHTESTSLSSDIFPENSEESNEINAEVLDNKVKEDEVPKSDTELNNLKSSLKFALPKSSATFVDMFNEAKRKSVKDSIGRPNSAPIQEVNLEDKNQKSSESEFDKRSSSTVDLSNDDKNNDKNKGNNDIQPEQIIDTRREEKLHESGNSDEISFETDVSYQSSEKSNELSEFNDTSATESLSDQNSIINADVDGSEKDSDTDSKHVKGPDSKVLRSFASMGNKNADKSKALSLQEKSNSVTIEVISSDKLETPSFVTVKGTEISFDIEESANGFEIEIEECMEYEWITNEDETDSKQDKQNYSLKSELKEDICDGTSPRFEFDFEDIDSLDFVKTYRESVTSPNESISEVPESSVQSESSEAADSIENKISETMPEDSIGSKISVNILEDSGKDTETMPEDLEKKKDSEIMTENSKEVPENKPEEIGVSETTAEQPVNYTSLTDNLNDTEGQTDSIQVNETSTNNEDKKDPLTNGTKLPGYIRGSKSNHELRSYFFNKLHPSLRSISAIKSASAEALQKIQR